MDVNEQLRAYKILLNAARRFSQAMDISALLDEFLDQSREVVGAEACSILLPDPDTSELVLHTTHPKVRSLPEPPRVPPGSGIAGEVFRTKTPLNIADAKKDPRHFQAVDEQSSFETRALLTIPLLDAGECLGVMQALNPLRAPTFDDDTLELFEAFGMVVVGALLRIHAQERELERARAKQELRLAQEIQASFLPQNAVLASECLIRHHYAAANEVGGDFYFIQPLPNGRLLAGLGDVSGKGVPAALTMARALAVIATLSDKLRGDLGQWVAALNRALTPDLSGGRFIAATFVTVCPRSHSASICAAGQHPPLLRQSGRWSVAEAPGHMPIGVLENVDYRAVERPLRPEDFLLLFSDGVTEARDPRGREFGLERLRGILPQSGTSQRTLDRVVTELTSFAGAAPKHDDASLLLVDWRGSAPPKTFATTCDPLTLKAGRDFIESWAAHAGFEDEDIGQIVLACDEAATNVYRYAYAGKPGPLTYEIDATPGRFVIRMRDAGAPCREKDVQGRDLDDVKPGGLGSVILRKVFDAVDFAPSKSGTVLTLTKRL